MSDHEPSYYEIALTNRQVMVAFVILLSCLLGTFFAGVWVGRSEAQPQTAQVGVRQADGERGVEELDFFAGGELGTSDAEPPPRQALPDPVSARTERESRQPEARSSEGPPVVAPGGAGQAPGQAATPDPPPPTPARPEATAPAPVRRVEPAVQEPAGGAVVQVFSSRDREQAERVVERLRNGGERPFLSPVEVDGQTMYRVRLGPYADRDEATRVAERVRRGYGLETWITQ
ncbi:MAG TPA: SPOR domain-containing protein [Thermoanaerobaculia bacterium]|nr:SPOR domain-containing protein [Thermoanaerobaculia bacterium]